MPKLAYKTFMDRIRGKLAACPPEVLREIILEQAENTSPGRRAEFLEKLASPPAPSPPHVNPGILKEAQKLAESIENGDYCDGWGWDHEIREERDWGDESWVFEVDSLFSEARDALKAGEYELAEKVYGILFDILDMGEEPGHLPGFDYESMLDSDVGEARSCFLRAVYLNSPEDMRADRMLDGMKRFEYEMGRDLNLESVINAGCEALPNLPEFFDSWIKLLKKEKGRQADYLLREAVRLSGGAKALEKLAEEEGGKHPGAYLDWIKALEEEKDFKAVAKAAEKGLVSVPGDYEIRADIALGLALAGEYLDNPGMRLRGLREAFYSRPDLTAFLALSEFSTETGCFSEELAGAEKRILALLKKIPSSSWEDRIVYSTATEKLLTLAYLLSGKYEEAYKACKNLDPLGWSYEENPKGLAVSFFMRLLLFGKGPSPHVELLWRETADTCICERDRERFEEKINSVLSSVSLSAEETAVYLNWCIRETGRRVDAIVGNKYRKSYHKAARLLLAAAETTGKLRGRSEGDKLIREMQEKYIRFSAFRREIKQAGGISPELP